ncbi:MAG: hypothetical protein EBS73_17520, partial [Betaproteobacteria bacterium]|nr:hypothetical protein [Betaproteobacteria bacterium]
VRPKPLAVSPASPGSLFPAALATGVPRPLFEDRRARTVGDILQVEFNEKTVANRSLDNSAKRDGKVELKPIAAGQIPFAKALNGANLKAENSLSFSGSGDSSATNAFTGFIMVMVTQVLSNGNLVISGIGFGLVVGLDGSGDQTTQTPFTLQTMRSLLQALGVTVPPEDRIQLRNTAAVMVTASLPPFSRPGQAVDVTVSSVGNAKSLRGGMLLMTPLRGADGQVYAMAQGSVLVPGAGAGGGGASVTVNHQSVGRVPSGAMVERGVQQSLEEDVLQIDLYRADFSQMQRVVEAVAKRFGPNVAVPLDGRTIQVRMPQDQLSRMRFLADLQALQVDVVDEVPRVIINSR